MSMRLEWEGHKIEVRTFLSGKYLMLAGETVVTVDGKDVARSGGFNFSESAKGTFDHEGKPTKLELSVSGAVFSLTSVPYVLKIEGLTVEQGTLSFERLGMGCLVWIVILLFVGGALLLLTSSC